MIDHGGDIDRAIAEYGGHHRDWIDLSTGINRQPYPFAEPSQRSWQALPTRREMTALTDAARAGYGATGPLAVLAGAQGAIQLLPSLRPPGVMRILGPSYNEYGAVFGRAGWTVQVVSDPGELAGADIAIVVNPNNPDGRLVPAEQILSLVARTGFLVVDESFMDMTPQHSVAGQAGMDGLLVLKSFGKFFGLAGLRLGFALGEESLCRRIRDHAGPWPVSGPAVEIGTAALRDDGWIRGMRRTLAGISAALAESIPWHHAGGTDLFRLHDVGNAARVQAALAQGRIWTRRFPWSDRLLRIGCPAMAELERVQHVIRDVAGP